jgi:hypothetical protein
MRKEVSWKQYDHKRVLKAASHAPPRDKGRFLLAIRFDAATANYRFSMSAYDRKKEESEKKPFRENFQKIVLCEYQKRLWLKLELLASQQRGILVVSRFAC